jgi:hypothetical protein
MKRLIPWTGTAAAVFALLAIIQAWLAANGYISAAVWAAIPDAILLRDGVMPFERFVTVYPPMAFFISAAAQTAFGGTGLPPPVLAAAIITAVLAGHWAVSLTVPRFALGMPLLAALLLALHPFTLYTVASGPAAVLLMGGVYWLTSALIDLSAKARVRDTMNTALALMVLAFTHPCGLIAALAVLPFLSLCTPRPMVERSALGSILVLAFPAAFAIASFVFIRFTFGAMDWTLGMRGMHTAALGAAQTTGVVTASIAAGTGTLALDLLLAGIAAVLAMPVLLQAVPGSAERERIWAPILAMGAAAVFTAAFSVHIGIESDAAAALAPFIGIVPAALIPGRRSGLPGNAIIAVLVMGLLGGILAAAQWSSGGAGQWRQAMAGTVLVPDETVAGRLATGRFLAGKNDVLADTDTAPELTAGRGSAYGMAASGSDEFRLALLTRQIVSRFVAVSAPSAASVPQGALARSFPNLFEQGLPGYRCIYDAWGWRVYERTAAARRG